MRTPLLFGTLLALLLAAGMAENAAATERQLASGRVVSIDSLGSARSDGEPTLVVKYRTTLSIQDKAALRREADEVWQYLATNTDCGPYTKAILTVTGRTDGIGALSSQNFVFDRSRLGWHTEEASDVIRLDGDFVKAFMARLDWYEQHGETDARLLYVDDDWTLTRGDESDNAGARKHARKNRSAAQRVQFHRPDYYQMLRPERLIAAGTADRHMKHEILEIALNPEGTRARVESRKTLDYVFNNHHYAQVVRLTEEVELHGRLVLVTKTDMTTEQDTDTDLTVGSQS